MKSSAFLAVALLAGLVGGASAKSLETTVTPANIKDQSPALEVKVKDADGLKQFEIVVKGRAGDRSRFLQEATLTIVKGGKTVARCSVAKVERKADVVFSFGISADHLVGSTFKLAAIAHVKETDKQGVVKWVGMPSGNFMTFPLSEFAKQGKPK
jgi:hypothetical protein